MPNSLRRHGLYVALQAPLSQKSPDKNTGMGSHSLLQGIFPTKGLNSGLLHCRQILYHLSHPRSPEPQFPCLLNEDDDALMTSAH